jgi:hypothetical protein
MNSSTLLSSFSGAPFGNPTSPGRFLRQASIGLGRRVTVQANRSPARGGFSGFAVPRDSESVIVASPAAVCAIFDRLSTSTVGRSQTLQLSARPWLLVPKQIEVLIRPSLIRVSHIAAIRCVRDSMIRSFVMMFTITFDNSKLRKPAKEHFEMRRCALATDTQVSGTPHELRNGGTQIVPNSVSPVHEWIAKR